MESVLGRYRNLIILVGVLFLQVLGLAMQVTRGGNDAESTRLIRIWVVGAITPFERGLVWIQSGTGNLWHNYFYLRGVRAENRQLKAQIEQMRLEQVRLSEDAAQARRLQTLLAFKEQFISKTIAAQVIGSSGSDLSRIVYIDKGEEDGLKRDMAVITTDGVVGKILQVYKSPRVAQVLLISDQSSGVGAILEKARLQGVIRGTPSGEVVLERVMSDEQVPIGETVLTSGGDQIFPKGLPVGTVTKVGKGKDLFLNIKIRPAANLSKLEEVLVLVEKQERQALAEDAVRVRAADILAQRLPSVPDKPSTDAKPADGAPAGSAKPSAVNAGSKPAGSATTPQTSKNPPSTATAHSAPVGGQTGKTTDLAPAVQKSAAGTGGLATGSKPSASSIKPATTAPKTPNASSPQPSIEPSSTQPPSQQPVPPQSNPQSPAEESSPQ